MKTASTETERKNVTLSLPGPLLKRFRIYAAKRNQSMTSLAALAIHQLMDTRDEREQMKNRLIESMRNAPNRGTGGKIPWTRAEIHERTRDKA
ncbi:MAG: hypothetical protein ABI995_09655 [Acidobacteriota bacterium]